MQSQDRVDCGRRIYFQYRKYILIINNSYCYYYCYYYYYYYY